MEQPIIVTCALLILGLALRVSGMAISMDKQAESLVMHVTHNTTQCHGSFFSDELCFGDTTIEITDAVYGVGPCNAIATNCCPDPDDCTIPVEEKDPVGRTDYYNQIRNYCNNKRTCHGLLAFWIGNIEEWCTGFHGETDYVTLHYTCLTEADRLTTTATASTDVTISASSPTTSKPSPGYPVSTATATVVSTVTDVIDGDDNDDDDDGGGDDDDGGGDDGDNDTNSTQTIVIIAVIVVAVVAVVVAVTVWLVCRKRQANNTSVENKTATAQPASGMMTSHASRCVDDVDPYHTARPGGGSGPRGSPPAQGLNDVTKPATNPYDTGQPLAKPVFAKKPKPNPKAVDKPNIGADLYTEVVKVRPRKNVVLEWSSGEQGVEANNNGSDMTEAGDRASYDLVMQENYEYSTRQGVGGEGEREWHGLDGEGLPHKGRQDGDQDEQTDPDYDLVMPENNVYS